MKSSRTKSTTRLSTSINKAQYSSCTPSHPYKQSQPSNPTLNPHSSLIQSILYKHPGSHKRLFTNNNNPTQPTLSFKPQIHSLPFQLYPQTRSQIQLSKEQIFQRLTNVKSKKEKEELNQLIKMEKQEEKFKEKCTFKPIITEISKKIVENKRKIDKNTDNHNSNTNNPTPFDRLYTQAIQKKIQSQISQHIPTYIQSQFHQLTFQPNINPNSLKILNNQKHNLTPIHLRLQSILKQKRQKQKILQEQKQKQMQNMGQFKIKNEKTLQILQNKNNQNNINGNNSTNVIRRLLDDYYKQKQQKQHKILQQHQNKFNQQHTFTPQINPNLIHNTSLNFYNHDFMTRQQIFQQQIKQNLINKANQLKPTFKPEINKISQLLTRDRDNYRLEEKMYRLNYQALCNKQEKIQELEEQLYKECTFHPKINTISKLLQGNTKAHKCNCTKKQQNYEFKPQINPKSRHLAQNPTKPYPSKRKQQQLNKLKMQQQYKQLIQCTFQPQTLKNFNKQILKQNIHNIVPGAKQYIQKAELIKKKKIQKEQYKEKIFNLEKRYKAKSYTKVEEFKITKKEPEIVKLKTEAEERFGKECTFKPNVGRSSLRV